MRNIFHSLFSYASDSVVGNHIFRVESSILAAFRKFSNSSKEDIAGTVQCRFTSIFKHTNNEAYADNLHGNVIVDTERGTGYRNQKEGTAGYAGSAAGANCGNQAQKKRCRKIDNNSQCVGSS